MIDDNYHRNYNSTLQEGKKVHTGGGFSGKGFKFDETEAQIVNEKKKFQKAALGELKNNGNVSVV